MNIFENRNMTWPRVLLVSVLSAIVTAVLNCIPAFENTSFIAPATTYEVWIVLALYILLNCKGYKDAMAKTFVFFLMSQPLIYLLEVPFKAAHWELFKYYPFWGMLTILTVPGAAIAYRVKKGDILSAIILSIANLLMIFIGFTWMKSMIDFFPRYALATAFCFIVPFALDLMILKQRKSRIVSVLLTIGLFAGIFCNQILFPQDTLLAYALEEGNWSLEEVSPEGLDVSMEGESLVIRTHKNGKYSIVVCDEKGNKHYFDVVVEGANHHIEIGESK